MKAKYPDNRLSAFKATDVIKMTIWAENQHYRDTIEAAAMQRRKICEFDELSEEITAELQDAGFVVTRVEMMGGAKTTVKWG